MPIDKSLISGSTSLLILKLLSEKEMYGYEMIETLSRRSENVFELKAGTLYPLLHTLVSQGCLTCREEDVSGKTRKYYRITKDGRKLLKQKENEWNQYAEAVSRILNRQGAAYGSV